MYSLSLPTSHSRFRSRQTGRIHPTRLQSTRRSLNLEKSSRPIRILEENASLIGTISKGLECLMKRCKRVADVQETVKARHEIRPAAEQAGASAGRDVLRAQPLAVCRDLDSTPLHDQDGDAPMAAAGAVLSRVAAGGGLHRAVGSGHAGRIWTERALEFFMSAFGALDACEHRGAYVACCMHIARCFSERAAALPSCLPLPDMALGGAVVTGGANGGGRRVDGGGEHDVDRASDQKRGLRWQLRNLGEALWYYKRAACAAAEDGAAGGGEVVAAAMHGTILHNTACIRLRSLAVMLLACRDTVHVGQGGPREGRAEEVLRQLREWRRGWSWRRGRGDGRGWEGDEQSEEDSSGSGEGLSGESEQESGGNVGVDLDSLSGLEASDGEESEVGGGGELEVPIVRQEDPWEVLEVQRAADLLDEAAQLFEGARCKIEHACAVRHRDLARSVEAELEQNYDGDCGGGGGVAEMSWCALALQELPMPHVMACFDARFHEPRVHRRHLPHLTGKLSMEDAEALLESGAVKRFDPAARDNLTQVMVADAGAQSQAFDKMLADLEFRKAEMRASWRLGRFCSMARSADGDARYWALMQLDEMLVHLEVTLCDTEYRRERHLRYARLLAEERRARVQTAEAAADDHKTLLCIVKVALGLLRDEHRFVTGAALCVLKHAVEYGDDRLTASVRTGLHCVDTGEALELLDGPPISPGQDASVGGGGSWAAADEAKGMVKRSSDTSGWIGCWILSTSWWRRRRGRAASSTCSSESSRRKKTRSRLPGSSPTAAST